MGFHPEKYGCPTAKRRFSDESQDRPELDCDPGWYPLLMRNISQQSSRMSRQSTQNGVVIRSGEETTQSGTKDTGMSSNVQTSDGTPQTGNVPLCGPSESKPIPNVNMPRSVPVVVDIPGFDKKAYGHPSRTGHGLSTNATQKRNCESGLNSTAQVNPEISIVSEVHPKLTSVSESQSEGPQASPPHVTTALILAQSPAIDSTNVSRAQDRMMGEKMHEHRTHNVPAISQMNPAKKAVSLPRPQTFETLKQGSETPEQVIARLQAAGSREAFQRIKRKDHGENVTTTALVTLDHLRKPIPLESHGLQERAAIVPSNHVAELDADHLQSQSIRVEGRLSSINPPELVQEENMKRWPDMVEKNPMQQDNDENCGEPGSDNDSTKPMATGFGRLIHRRNPREAGDELVGWDGKFQPPPVDWEHRAHFCNNTPEYISGFDRWLGANTMRTMSQGPEVDFSAIPQEEVQNVDNHADGIGFAPKETVINPTNADRYGFTVAELGTVLASCPPDFDGDAKLDLSDLENARYKDETAQEFIDKRMEYLQRELRESQATMIPPISVEPAHDAVASGEDAQQDVPGPITNKNIYLRPAVNADVPGMKAILNLHIAHGIRPSELAEIGDDDMYQRLEHSTQARLPFIVAVERNRKNTRSKARKNMRVNPNHPIQNVDPEYIGVVKDEPIVGWAAATDWSACDYVETITAELELYVAPTHRKAGVGRCLMDALLDATDRGYMRKGGYEFRVAPETRHLYSAGGGRDLHKLIFQVRSFTTPIAPQLLDRIRGSGQTQDGAVAVPINGWTRRNGKGTQNKPLLTNAPNQEKRKDYSIAAKLDDREDDYEVWLKDWLASQGFEEEAHLKKLGTKNGRFVDVRYLTRETCWQPTDHRLPDFSQGL
ncbi:hypothetical protein Z517_05083 [Fonsecaea pedrosoi CBS 271.37]|uniref:N-acetyltransferase domain-containing protein n=1 Tax=Fonsecaea pedrosoi CBS 271.37 TaxID=1442368 RepID=A0A0D2DW93_9EURO|nr:uncharacterized protein Z517_05083 [Fonsecaea pedrosoi CBS 271.37]KIW82056.1 hypothetical protein Z517_05083 [Fonsecaea pedrosoi CBS 271.37]